MSQDKDKQPTPEQLRAEIAQRQRHLAQTVDQLTAKASPKALMEQGRSQATTAARGAVFTEEGELRVERIAVVTGAFVVLVGLSLWIRSRNSRA